MLNAKSRHLGCLLGLAVGDALGTTLEFQSPGSFTTISDMVGNGPFKLRPGEWTDDTSMALCLAASLVEKRVFSMQDQMERYVKWSQDGYMSSNGRCFDIGITVRNALDRFTTSGNPDAGSQDPYSAGNGSIMRLAPVPMFYYKSAHEAVYYSIESSQTTHRAKSCLDACEYFGGLIWGALNGVSKEELLAPNYSPLSRAREIPFCPAIQEIALGSFKTKEPPEIKGSGYVVKSLEAALWAFHKTNDFRSGCLLAVNLGDDADTAGAVYGQLAGAFYGVENIPESWVFKLAHLEKIRELALSLFGK